MTKPPDVLWQRIEPNLLGKAHDAAATKGVNRFFLEAVFLRERAGTQWRGLPPTFGRWNSELRRFQRWARAGAFESLLIAVSAEPDLEYAHVDGTID